MNNKLEFADGTIIDGSAGVYGNWLRLYMDQPTMMAHIADFMNEEKMDKITYYYGVYKNIYHGFNKFYSMEHPGGSSEFFVKLHAEDGSVEDRVPTVPVEYLPA